jgi:hypothetical protein
MNAYEWELVTQQITLHLVQHFPARHLVLASDCQSAMARTNSALRSLNNRLANTRAGIFSTGIHCFADPFTPRQFIYTAVHPENDHTQVANPTMRDASLMLWRPNNLPNPSPNPNLIRPSLNVPLSMTRRSLYIQMATDLTQPLLIAYREKQAIINRMPAVAGTANSPLPPLIRNIYENTFVQDPNQLTPGHPDLNQLDHIHTLDSFTLSDAACLNEYI